MRLLPAFAGFMLIAGAAAAQSAPDAPPPADTPAQMAPGAQAPGGQMAPNAQPQGGQMAGPGGGMRPGAGGHFKQRFEAANTTQDGKLTLEQAQAAHMGMIVRHFAAIDTDRKGYITLQDVKVWHETMKAGR